jgi:hypothetical protein
MNGERETGYREATTRPAEAGPTGEVLDATAGDVAALDRLRGRERSSAYGMLVVGAVLIRWVAPFAGRVPLLQGAILLGGAALFLYGLARRFLTRGLGPVIVRLSPQGELVAGDDLGVAVAMRPHDAITLDPLALRLVAYRSEGGGEAVAYESRHVLAEGRTVGAGQAVRVESFFAVPEDAPASSPNPRVRWRLELAIGAPPFHRQSIPVRVRASTRRRRARAKER